jgi:Spy/CpxP family protein refolding chaperone
MKLFRSLVVLALFGVITAGTIVGQEKGKAKGQLPSGWSKLGLSDEQKQKVYEIQAKYKAKIEDLEKQIKEAKDHQRKDELAVLTDAQKKKLKDMLAEKVGEKPGQ